MKFLVSFDGDKESFEKAGMSTEDVSHFLVTFLTDQGATNVTAEYVE